MRKTRIPFFGQYLDLGSLILYRENHYFSQKEGLVIQYICEECEVTRRELAYIAEWMVKHSGNKPEFQDSKLSYFMEKLEELLKKNGLGISYETDLDDFFLDTEYLDEITWNKNHNKEKYLKYAVSLIGGGDERDSTTGYSSL